MSDQQFIKKVIKKIARNYYGVVDYNVLDTGEVELLNETDRVVGIIDESQLTDYFVAVEQGA